MVYRVLGRLLWRGGLERAEVVILHRGAPGDRKVIPGRQVTSVKRGYLLYRNDSGEEIIIPLHRVLEVRLNGETLWKRKEKPQKHD